MARRPSPLKRSRDHRAEDIRAQYSEVAGTRETLTLKQISERVNGDTRELDERHVLELMESIEILGLISPLTIDREGTLLAGGHRRAALAKLAESAPDSFELLFNEGIPVYRLDLIASEAPVEALQVEIEENTQRRNYTAQEIQSAAKRLEAAGFERLKGRPRDGQKSLKQALQRIFKLSDRRIQAILNADLELDLEGSEHSIETKVDMKTIRAAQKRTIKQLSGLERQLSLFEEATSAHREALSKIRAALTALEKL